MSSRLGVVPILHIPEMFHFHHSSHLWVASTRHHEPKSILISYPFRALSSWPKVVFLIYDPESFLTFKSLSSRPRVVLLIYDPESFLAFKALNSWPRVVLLIYDPKSFLAFRALNSRPRVVLLIYGLESFLAFKALSSRPRVISSHLWPKVILSIQSPELTT